MTRKLRIMSINVQAVLVWDNGEELAPGPELRPVALPPSGVEHFLATLPAELAELEAKMTEPEPEPEV